MSELDQWHNFKVSDQLIAEVQHRTFVDDRGTFLAAHFTFDGNDTYATVTARRPGLWDRLRFAWMVVRAR